MIDEAVIHIISGKGGNGIVSGRREKYVPRGGPDGGDGGNGGSVYLRSDPNESTLLGLKYQRRYKAGNGGNGGKALKHGRNGEDVTITVPVGTQVWTLDDPPQLLADLSEPGMRVMVARGGRGGRGNARFTTSTNRFPLLAEEGEPGEEMRLRLELKLLADVGIVGVPNAGKSSLLASVSAAKPRIAEYPFTTLEPVLGVVDHQGVTFVMVDIPGLIEGAHQGVGLGHDFLRHVERTRVLVHLLDGASEDLVGDYRRINTELGLFSVDLAAKPQIVAINKVDLPDVRARVEEIEGRLSEEGVPVFTISAATREGVDALLSRVLQVLDEARREQAERAPARETREVPVLRPRPRRRGFEVWREDGVFVVDAPAVARMAAVVDHEDWNARMQFYGYLKRIGLVRALEDAGVTPGDVVRIGDFEWEWE